MASLLEQAMEVKIQTPSVTEETLTDEMIELAVAFFEKRVVAKQVFVVLWPDKKFLSSGASSFVTYRCGQILIKAIELNKVKINTL